MAPWQTAPGNNALMDIEIRALPEQDIPPYWHSLERTFGETIPPDELEAERQVFEPARSIGAYDGPEIIGTAGIFSLSLTVPGSRTPMAGVTQVGVQPTHRRRGILTQLMRRQMDDLNEGGEAVAGLWASESSIYGRFGYGMAAPVGELQIERGRSGFARPHHPTGRVRLLEKEPALEALPQILDRFVAGQPGLWARNEAWWRFATSDLEHWREGASPMYFVLHEGEGGPDGYAIYRIKPSWEKGFPAHVVKLRELVSLNPAATADLWRYVMDIDLVDRIEAWPRPPDDPLQYLLAEPRRLSLRIHDGLWVRLVRLDEALAARRYRVEDSLSFEVRDAFCPWNEGRYELEGGPDGAACRPSGSEPDLTLWADDLAAVYLGGVRFSTLHRAGRVLADPGPLARADAMFGWDPRPWCHQVF